MPAPTARLSLTPRAAAEPTPSMEEPGQKLKRMRERLNLRYRDVEEASQKIAEIRGSDEFAIVLSRLADIENKGTVPTIFRLYSLCAIYRLDPVEVLDWYGVDLSALAADAAELSMEKTHLVGFGPGHFGSALLPLALDPGIDLSKTTYLSRMIQKWGTLPLMLLNRLNPDNYRYALVGTEDWSMYPILHPGALVVIDETRRKIANSGWTTEFERPIYFLEHRNGYALGWCSLEEGRLIQFSHSSSQMSPQVFEFPQDVDVIGQVTAVAMQFAPAKTPRPRS
jgi:transcriptional regulator with XRE-family HTH domain